VQLRDVVARDPCLGRFAHRVLLVKERTNQAALHFDGPRSGPSKKIGFVRGSGKTSMG
jgi:hypothetical protein